VVVVEVGIMVVVVEQVVIEHQLKLCLLELHLQ
jgi:hypothetical protein